MKTETAKKYRFVIGFVVMVMIFWGCKNEINDLGKDLLLPGDLVQVRVFSEKNIKAYTVTDGNQRTDEPEFNLLGTFNDPLFGKTIADFACQFRIDSFPDHSNFAEPDSLVLYFLYKELYGDTLTPQRFKVYELASDLSLDGKYFQDVNLKSLVKPEVIGERIYRPRFELDSLTNKYGSTKAAPKDTLVQEVSIKLNTSLLNKLWAADSLTMSDNDRFTNFFKGLYLEVGDLNEGGSLMKVFGSTYAPQIVLHFHNSETDSLTYSYRVSKNAARVSRFTHDYSNTAFAANLDKLDGQDSLIYLQTTGGLRTKILIPDLGTWKDSTDFAINKAELIFTLEPELSDTTKYPPAEQLVLSAIGVDKEGKEIKYLPSDFTFSQAYYGGVYNHKDKTYRFNIANHLQEVIDGKKGKENMGFYLSTSLPSSTFGRVVLKGATSKTGIKLDIAYSKIK